MTESEIRKVFDKSNDPPKQGKQAKVSMKEREEVRKKTGGFCHFCGGKLGKRWHVDHVVPSLYGGPNSFENYLPICRKCNGLRWSHSPQVIRQLMRFGIIAKGEIRRTKPLSDKLIQRALQKYRRVHI